MAEPVFVIRGEVVAIIARRHKTEALVCWYIGDQLRFFICEVCEERQQ